MLSRFSRLVAMVAMLAMATPVTIAGGSDELCALPTISLQGAVTQYSDAAFAIQEVMKHAIASWYTDRISVESSTSLVQDITKHCDENSRMTLVVYGLPNKDCDAGYSSGGFNKSPDDYKKWLQTLVDTVGQRKVLYILEPDAVGLMAKGGCGATSGYEANVMTALQMLTKNPNADVYLDVGYWTLMNQADALGVANVVKKLAQAGRLKGISLNTSNYRSTKQISELCGNFQTAYGDNSLHCVIDTSRNYNDNPPSSEWCNARFGGVGRPPTSNTGYPNLDYFIWIKPAGESDGLCNGSDQTPDAMKGPEAGAFFKDFFVVLWNNGYYVKEQNLPAIDGTPHQTTSPSSSPSTPAPQNGADQRDFNSREMASPETEADVYAPVHAENTDDNKPMFRQDAKSVSFAATDSASSNTLISGAPVDNANTKANEAGSPGIGGGVIAAIVVAGVMIIAVAAVVLRRSREKRHGVRESNGAFGHVTVTPAGITVL